jgi:hypothetical protein
LENENAPIHKALTRIFGTPEEMNGASRCPERIEMLREAERGIGPGGRFQSFFDVRMIPGRFHSETYTNRKGKQYTSPTIDDVVRWSHTGRGAKEIQPWLDAEFDDDATLSCAGGRGFCE